jgi:hypothetical protein
VVNPWKSKTSNADLTPGGSSGGSASAVAGDLCLAATASDTGGSIRQPAAFTGTVGIKPTYGRASRFGMVAFASSLDQAGPITKTVEDAAILLRSMCSFDVKDSTSLDVETPDWTKSLNKGVKGLRIGVPKEYVVDGMPAEIQKLWDQGVQWLKAGGAEIVEISLPHTKYALPAYYIIAPAEASSNLARYDGMRFGHRAEGATSLTDLYETSRAEGFGKEVQRRLTIGAYVLSAGFYDAYYVRALKVRRRIAMDFDAVWDKVDAILTPSTPSAAFALGDKQIDPLQMYLNDIFTVTANLAGLPGISVPAGVDARAACRWASRSSARPWTRRPCSRSPARWKRRRGLSPSPRSGGDRSALSLAILNASWRPSVNWASSFPWPGGARWNVRTAASSCSTARIGASIPSGTTPIPNAPAERRTMSDARPGKHGNGMGFRLRESHWPTMVTGTCWSGCRVRPQFTAGTTKKH